MLSAYRTDLFSEAESAAMKRALRIARKGGKKVFPNPLVGAVVLSPDGRIVSEGYHAFFGGLHAERNALRNAGNVEGCTMVVTLEPCSHHGKTPPCVEAVAAAGISSVVVGMKDPNPLVAGAGIEYLKSRGIDVRVGLLADEAKSLNRVYLHYIETGRSFVHLKMAGTLDGRSAAVDGSSRWITSEESRKRVHEFRRDSHAVLVGGGTAETDDPLLTVRSVPCLKEDQPVRIVYTRRSVRGTLRMFAQPGRSVVATPVGVHPPDGVEVWGNVDSLPELLRRTAEERLGLILCEGGGTLAAALIRERLVDRISIFTAPALLGGTGVPIMGDIGVKDMDGILRFDDVTVSRVGSDILTEGRVVYRVD